jgi:hypothetical protein
MTKVIERPPQEIDPKLTNAVLFESSFILPEKNSITGESMEKEHEEVLDTLLSVFSNCRIEVIESFTVLRGGGVSADESVKYSVSIQNLLIDINKLENLIRDFGKKFGLFSVWYKKTTNEVLFIQV